ncbi:hypothetical protein Agub_g7499 [Astrephomene gubernaculifera]|uniref:Uncharacterized protein n=1 Tax=Astrephomene gubernaculifera TaxID=47775 RepID=A0AAD3HMS9_9CHLO|nr:hypothetical protein Agub_g7499 [Astrephomene gubernaculifera]
MAASMDGNSTDVFPITARTYARAGLFGNPSDQYGGRTIALSLANFFAEVTLTPNPASDPPSPAVRIAPHPVYDSSEYGSMEDLERRTSTQGLYGGVRLLTATCNRFVKYCRQHNIPLQQHADRGFTLSYDTNIPRQTGLAGSSAIIYSALQCLLRWYGISAVQLPPAVHPSLVLAVEAEELGVAAGLQDRVVQVYGGAVHMDFRPNEEAAAGAAATHGSPAAASAVAFANGRYRRLPASLLPLHLMWVMYSDNPSESGKVHSGVKARWLAGNPQVRSLMSQVACCADEGLRLLLAYNEKKAQTTPHQQQQPQEGQQEQEEEGQPRPQSPPGEQQQKHAVDDQTDEWHQQRLRRLADLMTANFELRRALFGDEVLGARNLRMVELARSVGAGVNFSGSGGAVVVLCPGGRQQAAALAQAAEGEGFVLEPVRLGPEREWLPDLGEKKEGEGEEEVEQQQGEEKAFGQAEVTGC